jgi:uncharacterized membrane protein
MYFTAFSRYENPESSILLFIFVLFSWCEIYYNCLLFQLLLAQPVTNPTTSSPVAMPSPLLPSVAAAMDHKSDESQVVILVIAVALLLMSLLEAIMGQPPHVLFICGDHTCDGLWQRSKQSIVK